MQILRRELRLLKPFATRNFSSCQSAYPEKILIANRGEIACRIMRTAKKMGIKTVAIYSEADAGSLHVRMADEAYCIGGPLSKDSYLNIDKILSVIKETGAQAVHPVISGYGFLSENFKFCEALTKHDVAFIGPNVKAIAAMGDKIESKIIAKDAGVHTIPGYNGVVENEEQALKISRGIGYPVMIKASAGGGGKGMRIAWNDDDVIKNFKIAATESKASFGDDRLLIEKFIDNPRHVEFQIIGDTFGNVVYLPERECSIQRRNQKVVEEAPSLALDEKTRKAMGEQAVSLAKRVGYSSAGTVEFLVDSQRNFYFLEMNTRLQVEHPITEYITGIDLVEQMIRVAALKHLPFTQDQVKMNGWAVECRVYAEDPAKYLPCIGRLNRYVEPRDESFAKGETNINRVRCDSGIIEGSEISVYYDPMICKLSTYGDTRNQALKIMEDALDSYVIRGVTHNISLLREVVGHPRFVSGNISTKFLAEEFKEGFKGHKLTEAQKQELTDVAMAVYLKKRQNEDSASWTGKERAFFISVGDSEPVKVSTKTKSDTCFAINNEDVLIDWKVFGPLIHATIGGNRKIVAQFDSLTTFGFKLIYHGSKYDIKIMTERQYELNQHMKPAPVMDQSKQILSPMPGNIVQVCVTEGQTVAEGVDLVVVEAMKMQNVMKSTKGGKIKKICVKTGQTVAADEILILFE